MKSWSFYNADGEISGLTLCVPTREMAEANAPPGHTAIEGAYDRLSQRVDVATQKVVDHQPPRPSAEHVWNATARRWLLSADAATRDARHNLSQRQIRELEASQPRAQRELLLEIAARLGIATEGDEASAGAKHLKAVEQEIEMLRLGLKSR